MHATRQAIENKPDDIKSKAENVMSDIEDWLNGSVHELEEIKEKINTMNNLFTEINTPNTTKDLRLKRLTKSHLMRKLVDIQVLYVPVFQHGHHRVAQFDTLRVVCNHILVDRYLTFVRKHKILQNLLLILGSLKSIFIVFTKI